MSQNKTQKWRDSEKIEFHGFSKLNKLVAKLVRFGFQTKKSGDSKEDKALAKKKIARLPIYFEL